MNEVIGCGKLEVFTELKQHFGTDDAHSHISFFAEKKQVQKRESRVGGNDEIFRAYEASELKDEPKKKEKDKKKRKDKNKDKKPQGITTILDKHIQGMKVKDIRPLHLNVMDNTKVKQLFKDAKNRFNLRFHDNKPLRRLTSLFSRGTQIKLKEIEESDIDYFGQQALVRYNDDVSQANTTD